jgi:hypothetical protein
MENVYKDYYTNSAAHNHYPSHHPKFQNVRGAGVGGLFSNVYR